MPWNSPFWQVVRFAAPALAAGNAALLKHAPSVTGCALAAEDVFRAAAARVDAPVDLFTTLLVDEAEVASVTTRIVDDPRVAAVTLTGSERAGTSVAAVAARALKKSVLELLDGRRRTRTSTATRASRCPTVCASTPTAMW